MPQFGHDIRKSSIKIITCLFTKNFPSPNEIKRLNVMNYNLDELDFLDIDWDKLEEQDREASKKNGTPPFKYNHNHGSIVEEEEERQLMTGNISSNPTWTPRSGVQISKVKTKRLPLFCRLIFFFCRKNLQFLCNNAILLLPSNQKKSSTPLPIVSSSFLVIFLISCFF